MLPSILPTFKFVHTSGGEYIHHLVEYSSFVHFKISSKITSVNILCHTCTTCLIIKILNDKENKLNMIIRNCELEKKSKHSLPEKVGDLLKYTHTTYCLQKSRQETQSLMWPTVADAAFDKVQVQRIHGQLDHDNFYKINFRNIATCIFQKLWIREKYI